MAKVKSKNLLNGLDKRLENKAHLVLFRVSNEIAVTAADLAPVLSGALKRSIRAGDIEKVTDNVFSVRVGSNMDYAVIKELGYDFNDSTVSSSSFVLRTPFLQPAWDEHIDQAVIDIQNEVLSGMST